MSSSRPEAFRNSVFELVRDKGPIKAMDIAFILGQRLGRKVSRREVNLVLYGPLAGQATKDPDSHLWSLKGTLQAPEPEVFSTPDGIEPTPEQRALVTFEPSGNLLIRGEAGSGKTTVLACRAGYVRRKFATGSLLFVTYNSGLAAYVRSMLALMGASEGTVVTTFHAWAQEFIKRMRFPFRSFILTEERKNRLGRIVSSLSAKWSDNHLSKVPIEFWSDEVTWIYGQGLESLEEYQSAPRVGRGSAIQVRGSDREFVWEVFESYRRRTEPQGEWDIENPSGLVRRCVEVNGGMFSDAMRVDHVFVDEVQDFNRSWFLALAPIARESITLAGDLAQRIYKRYFTWKEVGIHLTANRSRKLSGSHRTTKSIMQVALFLATNTDLVKDDDYVPPSIPDREGPRVRRVSRALYWQARDEVAGYTARLVRENPGEKVAVATPFGTNAAKYERALKRESLHAVAGKGEEIVRSGEQVIITTYHQLKGLEFDHVVLTNLEDDAFPGWFLRECPEEDREQEEAFLRRLLYVAMTRAKRSVTLVGGRPFCRFLSNVPDELFDDI